MALALDVSIFNAICSSSVILTTPTVTIVNGHLSSIQGIRTYHGSNPTTAYDSCRSVGQSKIHPSAILSDLEVPCLSSRTPELKGHRCKPLLETLPLLRLCRSESDSLSAGLRNGLSGCICRTCVSNNMNSRNMSRRCAAQCAECRKISIRRALVLGLSPLELAFSAESFLCRNGTCSSSPLTPIFTDHLNVSYAGFPG